MTKLYPLLVAASLIFIYSCKSASKSYQKGDYTDAIERGVKKLQKDPNDYETRDLVQKSYTYTVNEHEDQIRMFPPSAAKTRDWFTSVSRPVRMFTSPVVCATMPNSEARARKR